MQMQVAGNKGYSINRPHMFAVGIMMLIYDIYFSTFFKNQYKHICILLVSYFTLPLF